MNAFKNMVHVKCGSIVSVGLYFLAILISPAITPLQNVQAAIDEAMPDTIPAEVIYDWKDQDHVSDTNYTAVVTAIVNKLPAEYAVKYDAGKAGLSGEKRYLSACHYRRVSRMKKHEADLENIMFARHHNFGGLIVGYHDNSDPQNYDQEWVAKGALCILNMKNYYSKYTELLTDTEAVVRDPCISFDGKKVLFAMSGTGRSISGKGKGKGYKIFEMTISDTSTLKQLTFDDPGLSDSNFTVADFEPCYLQSGDIMFTSTRNFGMPGHGWNPSTNMFLMSGEGKYMRQVGFDQANTFYPVLMDDGTILYTRLEFNDRTIEGCMGLFVMNPDGSHQTEYFGNQTSWPMTMIHARPIPGSGKVIAVAGGYHGPYSGELMIIDRSKGYNGTQSVRMIAPIRETKPIATKADLAMGNVNFLFQNPCPLDENDFLVSWRKYESSRTYRLYFMDVDGNRELLAWADQSVSQPVLIKARKTPPAIVKIANYKDSIGSFTMQDVYAGEGMKGVPQGTAKSLRVVKLYSRVARGTIGALVGQGPSDVQWPAVHTPISAYGASWLAKEVLGEAKIYPDGSAAFKVPARTPVYFQVIDSMGYCIATMRSWSTLMPGENFACVGCHEDKRITPTSFTAQAGTPQKLDTPLGIENKPFDYRQMVQPIFDKNCVSCHKANHVSGFDLRGDLSRSLASKKWTTSYDSLLKGIGPVTSNAAITIFTIFSKPEQQPPRSFGSSLSGIMTKGGMGGSHHDVQVTQTEKKIVACWIDLCAPYAGKYNSYMSVADSTKYEKLLDKRVKWATFEAEALKELPEDAVIPGDHGNVKSTRFITERLSIVYVPTKHALVLKKFSQGNFILVDLRGKVISRMKISNQRMNGTVSISLPASLSTGLYVAGFEGVNGIRQAKIYITE